MKYTVPLLAALLLLPVIASAQSFVPLTSVPAFTEVASSNNIAAFLNNLYRIAIGVAAVLAVIQITRAGITYSLGDSVTEKKEARTLIVMSVLGLILVLSPAIVFGVIDSRILDLNVDLQSVAPQKRGTDSVGQNVNNAPWVSNEPDAAEKCTAQGGSPSETVGGIRCTPIASSCTVYPVGSTSIGFDEFSCCSDPDKQENVCNVVSGTRGQNRCVCTAPEQPAEEEVTAPNQEAAP